MDSERLKRLRDLSDDEAAREHRRQRERLGIGMTSRCVEAAGVWCGYELRATVGDMLDLCKWAWCNCDSFLEHVGACYELPSKSWFPNPLREHIKAEWAITSGVVRCETLLDTLATRVELPDLDEDDPVSEFSVRLLEASRRNMEEGDV